MRVGILFNQLTPDAGGGFTFQEEIFEAFKDISPESRHSFIIFCNALEEPWVERSRQNLEMVYLPQGFFSQLLTRFLKSHVGEDLQRLLCYKLSSPLARTVSQQQIDLMWFLTPDSFSPLDVPYITIVWDLQHRLQPWFPEVSAKGAWESRERYYRTMLQRASFIITGNERGKNEIKQFYQIPPERIKILPHPTPSFGFNIHGNTHEEVLKKLGVPPGYLFYPAQFWPHKNHVTLLKALSFLRAEYKLNVPLIFTGSDKGNQSYIKQLVLEQGLEGQVHFLGLVSREEIIALYRNALALTYPSYFGPENLPPLEAFALGCPVVAARVPGAEEQLGDAAWLFDPQDHVQLGLAIKSLMDDPSRRRELINRGKVRAASWTPKNFVREIFNILDDFEAIKSCWG